VAFLTISLVVVLRKASSSQRIHAEGADKVLRVPLLLESVNTSSSDRLSASGTEGSRLLVIVSLAIRLSSKLEEASSSERLLAVRASKVLWMPLRSQSVDAVSSNRLVATHALRSEVCVKVLLAIRSSIAFVKVSSLKRLQALRADEVIDVPLLSNRGDASIQDWLIAVSALRAEEILEAVLAVGATVLIVKVPRSKGSSTVSAGEVFGVEGLSERLDNFSENRSFASVAISSRCGVIAVDVVHLRRKVLK